MTNINNVFETLLLEHIERFRNSFSDVSKQLFFTKEGILIHPGEYGMYREAICKDFIRLVIPSTLDIEQGFIINTSNEISYQCDIIVYDSKSTPLIQTKERQRFFPVETVCAVGEVKSILTKDKFEIALNNLSTIKKMREKIKNPAILKRQEPGNFNPQEYPYDQVFTFLICQKLDFDLNNIAYNINSSYEQNLPYRHRHNLILSLEDGILLYHDKNTKSLMYPRFRGDDLKNRFVTPGSNSFSHYKLFASYIFLHTSSATILYPELSDYMGTITGGWNHDEEKAEKPIKK